MCEARKSTVSHHDFVVISHSNSNKNVSGSWFLRLMSKSVGIKNDSKNRVENFESMNMPYVVEQLDKAATLEFNNVKLKKLGPDSWE